jgi:hypothetical protein
MTDAPEPELTVHKAVGYMVASKEMLMDCGVIPDTRPPPPPPTWQEKLRRRAAKLRDAAARQAYRRIAGHDIEPGDDDYW